jgi:hypothetical protein
LDGIPATVVDAFPNLKNLPEKIKALPEMAGYSF